MGKVKATNAGSCQACGRVQKVPCELLSLHGYSVQWHCFNGQCPGSKHAPYELSCELIRRFVANARENRAAIQARINELNRPATEPKAWFSEYVPATWANRHARYQDREITLFVEADDAQRLNLFWFDLEGKRVNAFTHSINTYGRTVLEVATEMNQMFAERELAPRVKQLDEYIRWQAKRVTDWKLAPLRDLKEVR